MIKRFHKAGLGRANLDRGPFPTESGPGIECEGASCLFRGREMNIEVGEWAVGCRGKWDSSTSG
jgi:hypothetical protein